MNKEQFLDEYEKVNAKIKAETGNEVPTIVIEAVMTLAPFIKARKAMKRGEYTRALCYLAIWHSYKATYDNRYIRHTIKRQGRDSLRARAGL